jgi:hypothetical protein
MSRGFSPRDSPDEPRGSLGRPRSDEASLRSEQGSPQPGIRGCRASTGHLKWPPRKSPRYPRTPGSTVARQVTPRARQPRAPLQGHRNLGGFRPLIRQLNDSLAHGLPNRSLGLSLRRVQSEWRSPGLPRSSGRSRAPRRRPRARRRTGCSSRTSNGCRPCRRLSSSRTGSAPRTTR